jgi:hypothetical protein
MYIYLRDKDISLFVQLIYMMLIFDSSCMVSAACHILSFMAVSCSMTIVKYAIVNVIRWTYLILCIRTAAHIVHHCLLEKY